MSRKARIKFSDPEQGAYHIICRALQREYRLKEAEKQKFLSLLRWLSEVYFVRVATFSLMTTHVHLVVKMIRKSDISEEELKRRFDLYYNRYAKDEQKRELLPNEIPSYYERFSDISRFMQDLKQRFSRWYNETNMGFGHVWAERFKSVLLMGTSALRACMIYVELNALRAGIVREPEKYPYCGLYYFLRGGQSSAWLDTGLLEEVLDHYDKMLEGVKPSGKSLDPAARYLALVYEEGMNLREGKASIAPDIWNDTMSQLPDKVRESIYLFNIPQFSNGIVLGTREDCESQFEAHRLYFRTEKKTRNANPVIKLKKKGESRGGGKVADHCRGCSKISTAIESLFSLRSTSITIE